MTWICGFSAIANLMRVLRENGLLERGMRDDRYDLQPDQLGNLGDDQSVQWFTYAVRL